MSHRRLIAAAIASLFGAGRLLAQSSDEVPPLRVDLVYASRHVFRGVERARDSVQASVEFNREGFRGGAGLSQPFDRDEAGELKLNAGYAWVTSGGIALEATVAGTWFSDVPGVDRSLEAGLRVTLAPAGGFTPSLAYQHDFRFDAEATEVSFARSIPLTKLGAFLELNLYAGLVQGRDWRPDAPGPRLRDGYGYWGGEVSLPYRVGPHSTVVAGIHCAGTSGRSILNGPFGGRSGGKTWVTLGVNLDF
jgi:hypothetical protein